METEKPKRCFWARLYLVSFFRYSRLMTMSRKPSINPNAPYMSSGILKSRADPCGETYLLYSLTPKLEVISVSSAVRGLLGYEPEEIIGRNLIELPILAPEYHDRLKSEMDRVINNEPIPPVTYEFISRDGKRKLLELTAMPLRLKGEVCGIIGSAHDVTEAIESKKRIQTELLQADKMISLGVLVSGVAHEINNPNNFIMLNAPILREAWDDAFRVLDQYFRDNGDFKIAGLPYAEFRNEIPHLLSGIEEGSRRIQRIVQDLREYAHPSSLSSHRPVQVNDIVEKSINLVQNMIKKSTKNFRVSLANNIPPVNANSQQIEQVIINLIQNACQALTDKNQSISITTSYDEKNDVVVIIVQDEGKGINGNIMPYIIDPFFTTKPAGKGSGLGLAVSDKIINEHGGKLLISSEKGKGAKFKVILPRKRPQEKKNVLIVDDDESFRRTLTESLRQFAGLEVDVASNGIEACIKIGKYHPALLVLDIMMPGMDGVEVCKMLRNSEELSGIKVLIVTGIPHTSKLKELHSLGYHNVLMKPFKLEDLLIKIRQLLE